MFRDFFFFFQNNTNFQTILLVSIVSKLFRKLISRVFETRVHCSNSSITDLISMKFVCETRVSQKITQKSELETHKRTQANRQKTKIKP